MISNPDVSSDDIIKFVKDKCQTISLKPWTLGMLFEMYVGIEYDSEDELSYFSDDIKITGEPKTLNNTLSPLNSSTSIEYHSGNTSLKFPYSGYLR